jgi:hypothetical protein
VRESSAAPHTLRGLTGAPSARACPRHWTLRSHARTGAPSPSRLKEAVFRVSARNNCTSCLSFGPSPALHSPAHIPICAGECAWVTNQNPAPYCVIIYCRDPYTMQALWSMTRASADVTMVVSADLTNPLILLVPPAGIGPAAHGLGKGCRKFQSHVRPTCCRSRPGAWISRNSRSGTLPYST